MKKKRKKEKEPHFTPKTSQKYLDIITNIINNVIFIIYQYLKINFDINIETTVSSK